MTEVKTAEDIILELKSEIEELRRAIEDQQEKSETKRGIDFNKVKNTLDDGAKSLLAAIRPVIDKYEEPGRAAVSKVSGRVSDNPFISVIIAFGAGIVIGKLLDQCCQGPEEG